MKTTKQELQDILKYLQYERDDRYQEMIGNGHELDEKNILTDKTDKQLEEIAELIMNTVSEEDKEAYDTLSDLVWEILCNEDWDELGINNLQ